jgi:hypothetical protein
VRAGDSQRRRRELTKLRERRSFRSLAVVCRAQNAGHGGWYKEVVMDKTHRLGASKSFAGALAIFLAIAVQAAPFDEKSKAPRAASSQALRTRFEAHFRTFERKRKDADPGAFIRDLQAHKQWSELFFAVKLALDERVSLKELSDFGLAAQPDGSYVVDLQKFPQWQPLDTRLYRLSSPDVFESYVPALLARGFRDEDIATLRKYLATHDPRLRIYAEGRQLVETFAKRLKARAAVQPLDLEEMLAYRYQKESLKAEVERRWAVALLDALDPQRQRILTSFLDEFDASLMLGSPTAPLEVTLEQEAQPLVSGDYVQILTTEEAELHRDVERRAEKLMEGEPR